MPRNLQAWRNRDFTGGLNTASDSRNVAQNESPDLSNVTLERTYVRRRNGFTTLRTTAGTALKLIHASREDELLVVEPDGDVAVFYPATSTYTVGVTGKFPSGFTAPLSAYSFTPPSGTTMYVIHTRGIDDSDASGAADQNSVVVFDGVFSGGRNNPAAPFGTADPTAYGAGHIKGYHSAVLRDRVFIGNVYDPVDGTRVNRVRFSQVGDFEYWAYGEYFDVGDSSEVTGLAAVNNRLLILKERGVYLLTGDTFDSYSLVPLSEDGSEGCLFPKTLAVADGIAVWFGLKGVVGFDGRKMFPLSEKIDPIPGTPVCGFYYDRKYYLQMNDAGDRRMYVYDFELKAWTRWAGVNVDGMAAVSRSTTTFPQLVATRSTAQAIIQLESGDTDAGANITAYYTTGWQDLGSPEQKKRTRRFYLTTVRGAGGLTPGCTVKIYADWDDSNPPSKELNIDADTASMREHDIFERSCGAGSVRALRFRLENSFTNVNGGGGVQSGGKMTISQFAVSYTPRAMR